MNDYGIFRKIVHDKVCPFHYGNSVSVKVVFSSGVYQFLTAAQSVYIKVIERQTAAIVLFHNIKSRAVDIVVNTKALC